MKKRIIVIIAVLIHTSIIAQITDTEKKLRTQESDTLDGWKKGGIITVNLNQTSLTNWAAGGQNSISTNGILNLFANNKKGNGLWENALDIGYGVINQGKEKQWKKTDDKIEISSKYGQRAYKKWYYALLLSFKTQMTPGYNYPNDSVIISNFFAPAYLVTALGMDYKPNDKFSVFIAPVTSRLIFVNDDSLSAAGAFGVEKGKKIKFEFGGYLRIAYKQNIMENVTLQTKLDLFSNYLEDPQNADVNWEVLLSMKVNKFISATLCTTLIYDDNTMIQVDETHSGPRTQFKEVLGVGFSYKFN
jgi:hypothetical protein